MPAVGATVGPVAVEETAVDNVELGVIVAEDETALEETEELETIGVLEKTGVLETGVLEEIGVLEEAEALEETGVLLSEEELLLEDSVGETVGVMLLLEDELTLTELDEEAIELLLDTGVLLADDWLVDATLAVVDKTEELLLDTGVLDDKTDDDELEPLLKVAALELADAVLETVEDVGVLEDALVLESGRTRAPQTAFRLAAPTPLFM